MNVFSRLQKYGFSPGMLKTTFLKIVKQDFKVFSKNGGPDERSVQSDEPSARSDEPPVTGIVPETRVDDEIFRRIQI
jgi:hypothetical protein